MCGEFYLYLFGQFHIFNETFFVVFFGLERLLFGKKKFVCSVDRPADKTKWNRVKLCSLEFDMSPAGLSMEKNKLYNCNCKLSQQRFHFDYIFNFSLIILVDVNIISRKMHVYVRYNLSKK